MGPEHLMGKNRLQAPRPLLQGHGSCGQAEEKMSRDDGDKLVTIAVGYRPVSCRRLADLSDRRRRIPHPPTMPRRLP
jgi:hypothetical protein